MKIFICVDIEGITGITNWKETELGNPEYYYFQKQLTNEVNSAIKAAFDNGATTVLVKDAHDSARNLLLDELDPRAEILRGWTGSPEIMMAGLDKTFDGVIFIGSHTSAYNSGNTLSHTMNTQIQELTINGKRASEFVINALYAHHCNVPVIFLSGDKQLCEDAKQWLPNLEVAVTKQGIGGATLSKHPTVSYQAIYDGVAKAMKHPNKATPTYPNYEVTIRYYNHIPAYRKSFYPGAKLLDEQTVAISNTDYYEILRAFLFIL